MDKKILIGSILGALVIFGISFGLLMLFSQSLAAANLAVNLIIFLLAPVAGGFLAGLVGRPNPRQAGTLAGSMASLMILATFLFIFSLSLQTLLTGLVVAFVWVLLARMSAGFSKTR
jgi:hypothetical protein